VNFCWVRWIHGRASATWLDLHCRKFLFVQRICNSLVSVSGFMSCSDHDKCVSQARGNLAEPERMYASSFVRGDSSSRRAVLSNTRPAGSSEAVDGSRSLTNKIVFPPPVKRAAGGMFRSSPLASTDPKRTVSNRHLAPNLRNYDAALKGVEFLSVGVDRSQ